MSTSIELRDTTSTLSPVHSYESNNHHQGDNGDVENGQNIVQSLSEHTLLQMIIEDSKMFQFLVWMGILKNDSTNGWKFWYYGLRVLLLFGALVGIFEFIFNLIEDPSTIPLAVHISLCSQNLFLLPILYYTYSALNAKRDSIETQTYKNAFAYAMNRGNIVFFVLFLISIVCIILDILELQYRGASAIAFTLTYNICTVCVSSLYLAGVYSILLVEQRISYQILIDTKESLHRKQLTDKIYLMTRNDMIKRDSNLPINWLLSTTLANTIVLIIILFVVAQGDGHNSVAAVFEDVIFCLAYFGRQIFILLIYLFEISKVNEIYDELLDELAIATNWEELEKLRWGLYISVKERPIGSTIFFFRPSRNAIFAQISSVTFAVGLAVFRAVAFA
jgi:hypothetical protein